MVRAWDFYACTVPIMRVAAALLIGLIAPLAVRGDAAPTDRDAVANGSWKFVVLNSRSSQSTIDSISLTRGTSNTVTTANAWSLQLGIVRPSTSLHNASFGPVAGTPIAGDFNGDGFAELGLFADGRWYIDMNANNTWDDGDLQASLGAAGDVPVIGDWNQDGKADIGVYTPTPGSAAVAVVGDWTGAGVDRIGLFTAGVWHLDTNGDGRLTSSDATVQLGQAGDRPIVGDFNRDGRDELGVYRNGQWIMDTNGDRRFGAKDLTYTCGGASDLPVIGDWDGDGRDQIGLLHR